MKAVLSLVAIFFASTSFAAKSPCLEVASTLAEGLDDVAQESYQGYSPDQDAKSISLKPTSSGLREVVEVVRTHTNEDGESWANTYKFTYNFDKSSKTCYLKSYTFSRK